MASAEVQWACLRKTSSFIRRQRGANKTFTREPLNMKNINSFRYNGLVHKKAVGVEPNPAGKGVVLVYKKARNNRRPNRNTVRVTLSKDGRRTCRSIAGVMKAAHFRSGMSKLAQRRASQILRSQKVVKVLKGGGKRRQKKEQHTK